MGTWSTGSFGNDMAADWLYELEEVDDLSLIEELFDEVLGFDDEYLEIDLSTAAIAACDVLARLRGNWGVRDAESEGFDTWVEAHPIAPPPELVQTALEVIDRILGPESELQSLWEESDHYSEWREAIEDLKERLKR